MRGSRRRPWSGARPGGCVDRRCSSQWLLEQPEDALYGDAHPVRPVVELVAQFVDRLLELEDLQQLVNTRLAGGQQRRLDRLEVRVEERLARPGLPALGGRPAALDVARAGGV